MLAEYLVDQFREFVAQPADDFVEQYGLHFLECPVQQLFDQQETAGGDPHLQFGEFAFAECGRAISSAALRRGLATMSVSTGIRVLSMMSADLVGFRFEAVLPVEAVPVAAGLTACRCCRR